MNSYRVITRDEAQRLADMIAGLPLPFTLTIGDGTARTLSQNALLHKWFGQVAKALHSDMVQIKGECHHKWGLPIKRRDPQFAWVWKHSGEHLNYEQQCALLASGVLNISSSMSVKELSEYMDAMAAHYRAQGIALVDPEERQAA